MTEFPSTSFRSTALYYIILKYLYLYKTQYDITISILLGEPFKNHVNNEVLRGQELPHNAFNAYRASALRKSHKSSYNQKEPLFFLNLNQLNQSKSACIEKPKKNRKEDEKTQKTSPKFAICCSL